MQNSMFNIFVLLNIKLFNLVFMKIKEFRNDVDVSTFFFLFSFSKTGTKLMFLKGFDWLTKMYSLCLSRISNQPKPGFN